MYYTRPDLQDGTVAKFFPNAPDSDSTVQTPVMRHSTAGESVTLLIRLNRN